MDTYECPDCRVLTDHTHSDAECLEWLHRALTQRDADLAALRKERDDLQAQIDDGRCCDNFERLAKCGHPRCVVSETCEICVEMAEQEADLTTTRALLARCADAFDELTDFSSHTTWCPAYATTASDAARVAQHGGEPLPSCTCGYRDALKQARDTLAAVRAVQSSRPVAE